MNRREFLKGTVAAGVALVIGPVTIEYFLDSGYPHGDVRRYGAIGDGITDNTKAFQRALDDDGYLIIPPGEYRVTSTLKI